MNFVKTYVLSTTATKFLAERFEGGNPLAATSDVDSGNSMFSQIGYQFSQPTNPQSGSLLNVGGLPKQKQITPSDWYCWPIIFLGAVFVLHGAAISRGP
jgi:hypothetical protein